LRLPLTLDVSKGTERYTLMRGEEQVLKPGDMFIRDQEGIISGILYGPDRRTQIAAETHNAVFTIYAPAGIGEQVLEQHLEDIREYVTLIGAEAKVELLAVFGGGRG
jgi:DNA/RNA-binding domain of Phe-tRNA-synthetase-like protein